MSHRPTTVERAYELAKSGECAGLAEVRSRLQREGYSNVTSHLQGSVITTALRRLCQTAFIAPAPDA